MTLRKLKILAAGDAGKASEALKTVIKRIDRIAAKGTIHKNTARRKKSRLQRRLNRSTAKT